MDALIRKILNGLDKGSAFALIALGLDLTFGTPGVVNFAHGALFMIGAFCAVTLQKILTPGFVPVGAEALSVDRFFFGSAKEVTYVEHWFGEATGAAIVDWSVPLAILFAIPIMMFIGIVMERGLIKLSTSASIPTRSSSPSASPTCGRRSLSIPTAPT